MSKILLHNIVTDKNFPLFTVVEIPNYSNQPKYAKFKNFLENNITRLVYWPACDNKTLGALLVENNAVHILSDKCIGCLLCFSTQRKIKDSLSHIIDVISKIIPDFPSFKSSIEQKDIFNGELVNLPAYSGERKIHSLAEFTATEETKHISLWGCSILGFISSDEEAKIGKEIEILKAQSPRDGRLDICAISGNQIIVCESKTDLDSLLTENRYRIQIPSYKNECQKILDEFNVTYKCNRKMQIYLLVGGIETDLLPSSHHSCTSLIGSKSDRFYNDLVKFNIKFISTNALWLMTLRSIILRKKLCWDLLFEKIFDDNSVGLVTAGLIRLTDKTKFEIASIPSQTLKSAETSFS